MYRRQHCGVHFGHSCTKDRYAKLRLIQPDTSRSVPNSKAPGSCVPSARELMWHGFPDGLFDGRRFQSGWIFHLSRWFGADRHYRGHRIAAAPVTAHLSHLCHLMVLNELLREEKRLSVGTAACLIRKFDRRVK